VDGPHAAQRSTPTISGTRLGLVVGSSLTRHPLDGGDATASPVLAYLDHTRALTETFAAEIVELVGALTRSGSTDAAMPPRSPHATVARPEERIRC
jgi:hypothetical protein